MFKLKNWVIFIFKIQRKKISYLMKMKIMMKMNMKSIYFKRNPWIVRKKQEIRKVFQFADITRNYMIAHPDK